MKKKKNKKKKNGVIVVGGHGSGGSTVNQHRPAYPFLLDPAMDFVSGLSKLEYAVLALSAGKVMEIHNNGVEAYTKQAVKLAKSILFETSKEDYV